MNKYAEAWLDIASEDLDAAELLYGNKRYPQAIFLLQQCNEKLSKAVLIEMGFIRTEDETDEIKEIRRMLKINLSAKNYGHRWHTILISTLKEFLKASIFLESKVGSLPNKPDEPLFFTKNLPNFKQRIKVAEKIRTNPDPPTDELESVIKFCYHKLNEFEEGLPHLVIPFSAAPAPDIDPIIKVVEESFQSHMRQKEKDRLKKKLRHSSEILAKSVALSQIVLVLATLSIFLVDHNIYSRYPSKEFTKKYDDRLAIVRLFGDLSSLHHQMISFIERSS